MRTPSADSRLRIASVTTPHEPALTGHCGDSASHRFSCREFPGAIRAGEHVLVDPALIGLGQFARPVVDDSANPIGAGQRVSAHVSSPRLPADAFAEPLECAMACDTNDGAAYPELFGNLGRRLLGIEREHQHSAIALSERVEAALHGFDIAGLGEWLRVNLAARGTVPSVTLAASSSSAASSPAASGWCRG